MTKWSERKRLWRIIGLFLGIFWSFYSLKFKKIWHRQGWLDRRQGELYIAKARKFRDTAAEMGGLLIKLGQFFSSRVDILPASVIKELEGLQDDVQAESFADMEKIIADEFHSSPDSIFASIETIPLAAASLGQVHKGRLADGREVAIKIQRPGIDTIIKIDLRAILRVITVIKTFTDWERYIDIDAIYNEFSTTIWRELDYIEEGKHAERIAKNNANPDLLIPQIYWEYTTRRVLTMEFMRGVKISEYAALDQLGINRPQIAQLLINTYCQQVFVDGFFHADPHPGNLFVTPENRLIMIDFGMVGSIPEKLKEQLLQVAMAAVKGDFMQVTRHMIDLGFIRPDANTAIVARAMGLVLEQVLGAGSKIGDEQFINLLDDIAQLVYEQPFQIPGNFTLLGRAAGTLYGLCMGLDPQINFLEAVKPYLARFMGDKKDILDSIWTQGKETMGALITAPTLAVKVLRKLDQGDITVRVPMASLLESRRQTTRALNSITLALLFGFTLLTSAYLLVHGWLYPAWAGFGLSLLFLLAALSRNKNQRRRRPHPQMINRRQS